LKKLIYLHGFNSSPESLKAKMTADFIRETSAPFELIIPALPSSPIAAIELVISLIKSLRAEDLAGFIGSSLGGYFSLYLQQLACLNFTPRVVLINPAIRPHDVLVDYLGENVNPYTGEKYVVELSHMDDLRSLSVPVIADGRNTFLLTQTGDEVLDFQQASTTLSDAKMWVQFGGDHSFQHYDLVLPSIINFLE